LSENLKTVPGLVPMSEHAGTSPLSGAENFEDEFSRTMVIENGNSDPAEPDARLQPGSVLRDRYLLVERVAAGNMGVVYKAQDRHLATADGKESVVAIKVLSPHLSRNKTALRALQQEAAKGRCLSHPHIVRFIDLDREDDLYFIVMEWLQGESLADALDNGTLPTDLVTAIDIVRQIGEALSYAHRCGVVHADVKPGNVMRLTDGSVKLFDFGIARVRQQQDGLSNVAASALRAATPAYSSMQVLTGNEPVAADDVFSLACLAYRLIAGHRVFGPRNAAEAAEAGMEPQRPQGLTDGQWKALRKGLAFSRVARQSSPMELVDDLMRRDTAAPSRDESISRGLDQSIRIPAEAIVERRFEAPRSYWPMWLLLVLVVGAAALLYRPDWRAAAMATVQPLLDRAQGLNPASRSRDDTAPPELQATGDQSQAATTVTAADDSAPATGSPQPADAMIEDALSPPPGSTAETTNLPAAARNDVSAQAAESATVGPASEPVNRVGDPDATNNEAAAAERAGQAADSGAGQAADRAQDSTAAPPASSNSIVLAAPGEVRGELAVDLPEDGGPVTVSIHRWFGLSEALLLRVEEVGFSGSRSPGEAGEYALSADGIVNFDPGQRNASITISPTQDRTRESDRQVTLVLRDYYNTASVFAQINLRLLDDDQRAFEIGIAANSVAFATSRVVVRERDPAAQIDVVRFNPDQNSLTVNYNINDFSATEGEDYFVPGRRVVTFGPGQRSARLLIPLVQDTVAEGEESFVIELDQAASRSTENNRVTVTILDDDLPSQ
jgi:serine/threonine protein kinase